MALTDAFVKQVEHKGSVIGERCADGGGMYLEGQGRRQVLAPGLSDRRKAADASPRRLS